MIIGGRVQDVGAAHTHRTLGCKPRGRRAAARAQTGKLPLIELEAEGAEALRARGADCLAIFLMPPSQAAFEARLRGWLAEGEADIAARQVGLRARRQPAGMRAAWRANP